MHPSAPCACRPTTQVGANKMVRTVKLDGDTMQAIMERAKQEDIIEPFAKVGAVDIEAVIGGFKIARFAHLVVEILNNKAPPR
jgi:hypothetical protein